MERVRPRERLRDVSGPPKHGRISSLPYVKSSFRSLRKLSLSSQLALFPSDTDLASSRHGDRHPPIQDGRPPTAPICYQWSGQEGSREGSKASSEGSLTKSSVSTGATTPPHSHPKSSCDYGADEASVVIKTGPLLEESSILKTRKEWLVLTPSHLVKFKKRLGLSDSARPVSIAGSVWEKRASLRPSNSIGELLSSADVQIPLSDVVAVFREGGTKPSFGIEIWWGEGVPFSSVVFHFTRPEDRTEWMKQIQLAIRQLPRFEYRPPLTVMHQFHQIIDAKGLQQDDIALEIYPFVPRARFGSDSSDTKKGWRDNSAFYMTFTKHCCLLAQFSQLPTGRVEVTNVAIHGLVTLSKVSSNPYDERFSLAFRLPLDKPQYFELSSKWHGPIVSRLYKEDTCLKPAWPVWTRREVFMGNKQAEFETVPEGGDFGGLKRTLDAFLDGYQCGAVKWKVKWRNVNHAPEFQLLPAVNEQRYTAHQLLALFRAMRYNDYFKSLSFRGVDLSALLNVSDNLSRLEPIVFASRTGRRSLTSGETGIVDKSNVLFQEITALLIGSESIKHVDFEGVLGSKPQQMCKDPLRSGGDEILAPFTLLLRSLQIRCKSVVFSGNPMNSFVVDELCQTLQEHPGIMKGLSLSRCQLGPHSMDMLWAGIHAQRQTIDSVEIAGNLGRLEAAKVSQTLCDMSQVMKLDLSYTLKGQLQVPLLRPWATSISVDPWHLKEINLSGWKVNIETISVLMRYLETDASQGLRHLILNNCSITGDTATLIFNHIGQGRDMHLWLNENPLEDGSTEWIDLIGLSKTPMYLHLDMIQLDQPHNFNRLLAALTENTSIILLSLVGTAPPPRPNPKNSSSARLLSSFFVKNTTMRFLDLSGYSGKLEDVRMGCELSAGALEGLRRNTTLRMLRIRCQDIGSADDGTLADVCRVVTENYGLRMLDVTGNGLTAGQHALLARAIEANQSLVSFPTSRKDREEAVAQARRKFMSSKGLHRRSGGGGSGGGGSISMKCKAMTTRSRSSSTTLSSLSTTSLLPFHKGSLSKNDETKLDSIVQTLEKDWELEKARIGRALRRNRTWTQSFRLHHLGQDVVDLPSDLMDAWGHKDTDLGQWLLAQRTAVGSVDRMANRMSHYGQPLDFPGISNRVTSVRLPTGFKPVSPLVVSPQIFGSGEALGGRGAVRHSRSAVDLLRTSSSIPEVDRERSSESMVYEAALEDDSAVMDEDDDEKKDIEKEKERDERSVEKKEEEAGEDIRYLAIFIA